jgi:DNA-binding NarL/FixJ family response regulator
MNVNAFDSPSQCRLACRKLPQNRHPGEGFLSDAEWSSVALAFDLTGRELSVAMLIFEGKTRYQIARALHCAPGTVRVYIDRLFAKLEVTDRLGMALRLVRLHLSLRSTADLRVSHKSATCEGEGCG